MYPHAIYIMHMSTHVHMSYINPLFFVTQSGQTVRADEARLDPAHSSTFPWSRWPSNNVK